MNVIGFELCGSDGNASIGAWGIDIEWRGMSSRLADLPDEQRKAIAREVSNAAMHKYLSGERKEAMEFMKVISPMFPLE